MSIADRRRGHSGTNEWMRKLAPAALAIAMLHVTRTQGAVPSESLSRPQVSALSTATPPRLVVFLVMDQFRADYSQTYMHQWTKGLRRLFTEGAVFDRAAYPYGGTKTCAGHATISTGALPMVHGMVGNDWFDHSIDRTVSCFEDPSMAGVPLGGGRSTEHYSWRSLRAPTFVDELGRQASRRPKVVSISTKPRSAISFAGAGGVDKVALWLESNGTFATSRAYTTEPWPDVDAYLRARPISLSFGEMWVPFLSPSQLLYEDDVPGESRPAPWGRTFPHTIHSTSGVPDDTYRSAWLRSPLSDRYLTELAIYLLGQRQLGRTEGTDVLTVSLVALDQSGHEFGPRSHEVQDVLARADQQLGHLLDTLDQTVGRGNYVLAFTSDHGVSQLPEYLATQHLESGRITSVAAVVNAALTRVLGTPTKAGWVDGAAIAFRSETLEALRQRPGSLEEVRRAVEQIPGVAKVYRSEELSSAEPTSDPWLPAMRLSYYPGRTADLMILPRRGWIFRSNGGVDHGTPYDYDQRVPLVLFGAGIRAGRYETLASPADIAPTLATLVHIRMPTAQGRTLTEALR
ncbi:MAG: alkaline phosphatase family protein [Vicinamibacterales bacterium]